jgi:hypothetical protein
LDVENVIATLFGRNRVRPGDVIAMQCTDLTRTNLISQLATLECARPSKPIEAM